MSMKSECWIGGFWGHLSDGGSVFIGDGGG